MELDLLLTGARVLTMDPTHPVATSVGVWQGRIVGVDDQVAGLAAAKTVELAGATVLPGFVDAHTHLTWTGLAAATVDISACVSVAQVLDVLARAARDVAEGDWLEVSGYDHRRLDTPLSAAALDTVSAGRLAYVQDLSGHACVVNTAVLDLLPAHFRTAGTPGVQLDRDGRPYGGLAESAQTAARALRLPYGLSEIETAIGRGARQALAEGVTLCAEAGVGGEMVGHSPIEVAAYQRARDAGRLPVRVQLMASADMLHPVTAHPADGIPRALDLGLRTGLGDDRLSIGALKVFTDGGMMARTAALSAPYAGTANLGELQADPAELTSTIVDGHLAGWQLAVHAIGDRAVDVALDAFAEAQARRPRPDARHRIEHCGLVRPDQLDRLAAAGVVAVVQPTFLWAYGDDYADIMGPDRAGWLYRARAFLDRGMVVAGSSDRPVADGAPLRAIQFLVQRTSSSGRAIGPDEAITVRQALAAYTMGGAYACHREHLLGSVTAGKLADLVVLGADPTTVDPDTIADIDVFATIVGGEPAHGTWP